MQHSTTEDTEDTKDMKPTRSFFLRVLRGGECVSRCRIAFVVLLLAAALGVAFWLSALNVNYRDVQYAIPFLSQLWFFATPIVYSAAFGSLIRLVQ